MAVVIETTIGDITVDLYTDKRPQTCKNFLKLCKVKYYNFCLFHSIQANFIAQTGDPTGSGNGGESVFGLVHGADKKYYEAENIPKIKHTKPGLLSMVNCGNNMLGSQFFITLGSDLASLDEHCVFAEVTEGMEILIKLNDAICDHQHRPYQDIRITHTVILEDPFDDLPGLVVPDASPDINSVDISNSRIGADEKINDEEGLSAQQLEELKEEREAKARATILEIVGDLPEADCAPPENVLFVCKLNPVTTDDDLEIIFSRFGKVKSCEVIRDHATGDSLQYAFVEFEDQRSCEQAFLKMDNVLIDDRRIHVDFSQSVSKIRWRGKGRGVQYLEKKADEKEVNAYLGNRHNRRDDGRDRMRDREARERDREIRERDRSSRTDKGRKEDDRDRRRDDEHRDRSERRREDEHRRRAPEDGEDDRRRGEDDRKRAEDDRRWADERRRKETNSRRRDDEVHRRGIDDEQRRRTATSGYDQNNYDPYLQMSRTDDDKRRRDDRRYDSSSRRDERRREDEGRSGRGRHEIKERSDRKRNGDSGRREKESATKDRPREEAKHRDDRKTNSSSYKVDSQRPKDTKSVNSKNDSGKTSDRHRFSSHKDKKTSYRRSDSKEAERSRSPLKKEISSNDAIENKESPASIQKSEEYQDTTRSTDPDLKSEDQGWEQRAADANHSIDFEERASFDNEERNAHYVASVSSSHRSYDKMNRSDGTPHKDDTASSTGKLKKKKKKRKKTETSSSSSSESSDSSSSSSSGAKRRKKRSLTVAKKYYHRGKLVKIVKKKRSKSTESDSLSESSDSDRKKKKSKYKKVIKVIKKRKHHSSDSDSSSSEDSDSDDARRRRKKQEKNSKKKKTSKKSKKRKLKNQSEDDSSSSENENSNVAVDT